MIIRTVFLYALLFASVSGETIQRGKIVEAKDTMIVTRHFLATEVGNNILKEGGNAIDASVAISFALAVVLPQAGYLGGGGFMVIHSNDNNYTIDYREQAPLGATENMFITDGKYNQDLSLESYPEIIFITSKQSLADLAIGPTWSIVQLRSFTPTLDTVP